MKGVFMKTLNSNLWVWVRNLSLLFLIFFYFPIGIYAQTPSADLMVVPHHWEVRAQEGDKVNFNFHTKNIGDDDTVDFIDQFVIDGQSAGKRSISLLKPKKIKPGNFEWSAGCGVHLVNVVTDAKNNVSEKNEENNITAPHNIWIACGEPGEEFPVAARPTAENFPEISGQRVVWVDDNGIPPQQQTIYVYNLATQKERILAIASGIVGAKISGPRVLWGQKNQTGGLDLFLYDLETSPEHAKRKIASTTIMSSFDIFKDKIVWTDNSLSGYRDVYLFDLAEKDPKPMPITHHTTYANIGDVVVSNVLIVWANFASRSSDAGIYYYDLRTGITRDIPDTNRFDWTPNVSGQKIVWKKDVGSNIFDIYFYDAETNQPAKKIAVIHYHGQDPVISGNIIAWIDPLREGGEHVASNIHTYNITSGIEKSITNDTGKKRSSLAISGNRLVWQAYPGFGSGDIYGLVLPKNP